MIQDSNTVYYPYPDVATDYSLNAVRLPLKGGCAVTALMDSSGIVAEAGDGSGKYWVPVCTPARSSLHPDPAAGMLEGDVPANAIEITLPALSEEGQGHYWKLFE